MQYGRFLVGAAVSAICLGAGMVPSQAQNSTQAASSASFETVVVTARKREENAQSVPIS